MSEPHVLLFVRDAAAREAICEALVGTRFSHVDSLEETVRTARTARPGVIVLDARDDEEAGLGLIRAVIKNQPAPRVLVLFADAHDPRREQVIAAGAIEHVFVADNPGSVAALVVRAFKRRGLEGRLDAVNRQVRALVENSNDAVYILRGSRFAYANPRFEEMTGYSLNELLEPSFEIGEQIIAPESRPTLEDRRKRIQQGMTVEPRYEFIAIRADGSTFDAQVSVSYIEFEGGPATLGLITDITERKQFEKMLVRKNRELALLNELAEAINRAVDIDETLRVGTKRAAALLAAKAAGLSLYSADRRFLRLRMHEGLGDAAVEALTNIVADDESLISLAARTGEVQLVDDVRTDPRVRLREVKDPAFEGAAVVPLKAEGRVLGVVFFFTAPGARSLNGDRELMGAVGHMLGTSIHKAELLTHARDAYQRLRALDDVALTIVSELEADVVAETVARRVFRMFGCERVMITRWNEETSNFEPLCALEHGERTELGAFDRDATLMGRALTTGEAAMTVHPASPWRRFSEESVTAPSYEARLFEEGFGCACAVPVVADGLVLGALHLSHLEQRPLPAEQIDALTTLSTHVAIAMKNAALFAAKRQALEDLKAAQVKLVESERLKALGELAAGVAHDFNNVLGAILGRAQLLSKKLVNPALLKHAAVIEKAAQDGAETVRRVQRLGSGKPSADDFVEVEVHEILQDVIDITMTRWREQTLAEGRTVEVTLTGENRPRVRGNPHELREVLINLVHNAVDAMPKGGAISLGYETDGNGICAISVVDSGTGIPAHVRERIFDPFFTTKGERGTGLGLSVSYSIIKRHGGELRVDSVTTGAQTGTTFTISLPRVADKPAALDEAPRVEPIAAPALSGESAPTDPGHARVLVIDDEENIREILQDILETDGHEVMAVPDGPAGLKALSEGSFDLVLTDLGLPGMTGWQVCAKIKGMRPQMPVGLITGWGATLDAGEAKEAGVDHIISKPFRFDEVLRVVEEALAMRRKG